MSSSFLESWPLFSDSYLLGWSLSIFLPLLGVLIVLRRQVFVAMAISQASVLGMALTLAFSLSMQLYSLPAWVGLVTVLLFSLLGSCLCLKPLKWSSEAREMATVSLFVLSTVFSYLVLTHAPLGIIEIQKSMSSSLISSVTWEWVVTLVLGALMMTFWFDFHRTVLLVCTEPETAKVMGVSVIKWELIISAIIGLGLGWSIHVAGWLFTFGGLIFPVYMARSLSTRFVNLLWLAPLLGLVLNVVAYVLSHDMNIPFSQGAVALMGVTWLVLISFGRRLKI